MRRWRKRIKAAALTATSRPILLNAPRILTPEIRLSPALEVTDPDRRRAASRSHSRGQLKVVGAQTGLVTPDDGAVRPTGGRHESRGNRAAASFVLRAGSARRRGATVSVPRGDRAPGLGTQSRLAEHDAAALPDRVVILLPGSHKANVSPK